MDICPLQSNADASSTAQLPNPPGAVIESFVRHSPGIFSGTFSGMSDLDTAQQFLFGLININQ